MSAIDVRVTQAESLGAAGGTASDLRITQTTLLTAYVFPSTTIRSTQGAVEVAAGGNVSTMRTTQAAVLVLWVGYADNRKLRAWGFSQDGHNFYVLRGGGQWSLVLDLTTGQWSRWATPTKNYLRAHLGLNWDGEAKTTLDRGYAWNVVGGDDTTGDLWILDPTYNLDDGIDGVATPFSREIVGGIPMRLRKGIQCGAVYLTANLGSPELTAPTVTLTTSDDSGNNWINHGSITVTSGDTTQELSWLGLGLITAPGRLFKITDSGALNRISSLDMRGLEE